VTHRLPHRVGGVAARVHHARRPVDDLRNVGHQHRLQQLVVPGIQRAVAVVVGAAVADKGARLAQELVVSAQARVVHALVCGAGGAGKVGVLGVARVAGVDEGSFMTEALVGRGLHSKKQMCAAFQVPTCAREPTEAPAVRI